MQSYVTCEKFFDGTSLSGPTRITLDDGVVLDVAPWTGACDHALVSPGLVDIQVNGWDSIDVAEADTSELSELDRALWSQGTAHWLGTIVTAPLEVMSRRLARLHDTVRAGTVPGLAGLHVEGPFLGRAPGAHDTRHIVGVDTHFVSSVPASVRLVTIAPEATGACAAASLLTSRDVTVSAGHSRPTREQFDEFVDAGASMVTHLFNGMSGIHHRDGGLALWALVDQRLRLGLVADGHHVSADAVSLAFNAAPDRVCLVSDSVAWASARATTRGMITETGVAALADGTLAGSCTSLSGCLRWVVHHAGVGLEAALRAATSTPASLIGFDHLGSVRVGHPADLVCFDDQLRVSGGLRRLASRRG